MIGIDDRGILHEILRSKSHGRIRDPFVPNVMFIRLVGVIETVTMQVFQGI